jgi:hypothetical protein
MSFDHERLDEYQAATRTRAEIRPGGFDSDADTDSNPE